MAKQQSIVQEGTITKSLSNAVFEVELDNGHTLSCTICGKMRQKFIRVMPGDAVQVEISPYDLTKGRISRRLRTGGQSFNGPTHRSSRR